MAEAKLIELNLYACGNYGAEYNESLFITIEDYIKYFGSGQDTTASSFKEYVEDFWENEEIYVGELDGKHSEVYGDVEVEFWDTERIAEYYEDTDDDGCRLRYRFIELIKGSELNFSEREAFLSEISNNVKNVVEGIGTKVSVTVRVPKGKVNKLKEFVERLNKDEE